MIPADTVALMLGLVNLMGFIAGLATASLYHKRRNQ